MSDIPQNPDPATEVPSHLRDYMREVMAGLRLSAMDLLVQELVFAFAQERYQLDEFVDSLAGYAHSQPGWGEVEGYLELASQKIAHLSRQSEGLPPK